ncbi:DUF4296 domain-containing protein [Spirosoma validum]|uniref:DUF4296 domain-containing protein n=1 Tax=Spirosoma validum TaxID=2771355 RepID=A0A927AXR0_9BACT|nr:DUF4296 domain-containing protein [Spirosoma validum]MBD2751745.1 DUF4296 domain-containing protein [Spirosoma validum]
MQKQFCLWSLLVSLWLAAACTAPEDQRPDNLIEEDRMAAILTEVHIAESRVSRLNLRSIDSSNIVYKHLERQIFKKFAVDTATYRKSYIFYSSHPADMEAIYKKVTQKLTSRTDTTKKAKS